MRKLVSSFSDVRIVKDSLTHNILLISKFYNKIISISDLQTINPHSFTHKNKVNRSLLKLSLDNLIVLYDNNTWIITKKGINYLYDFTSVHKTTNFID
jgi:hypothetical protein